MICPNHDDDACCADCTPGVTDGLGFPHPSVAGGRTPLMRCNGCGRYVQRAQWVNDIARVRFGCVTCYPPIDGRSGG